MIGETRLTTAIRQHLARSSEAEDRRERIRRALTAFFGSKDVGVADDPSVLGRLQRHLASASPKQLATLERLVAGIEKRARRRPRGRPRKMTDAEYRELAASIDAIKLLNPRARTDKAATAMYVDVINPGLSGERRRRQVKTVLSRLGTARKNSRR